MPLLEPADASEKLSGVERPFDVQWPQRCIVKVSRQQQTLDRRFVLARQAGGKKWFKNWFQTRSAAASTDLEKVENAPKSRVRPEASSSWPLGSLKLSLEISPVAAEEDAELPGRRASREDVNLRMSRTWEGLGLN